MLFTRSCLNLILRLIYGPPKKLDQRSLKLSHILSLARRRNIFMPKVEFEKKKSLATNKRRRDLFFNIFERRKERSEKQTRLRKRPFKHQPKGFCGLMNALIYMIEKKIDDKK